MYIGSDAVVPAAGPLRISRQRIGIPPILNLFFGSWGGTRREQQYSAQFCLVYPPPPNVTALRRRRGSCRRPSAGPSAASTATATARWTSASSAPPSPAWCAPAARARRKPAAAGPPLYCGQATLWVGRAGGCVLFRRLRVALARPAACRLAAFPALWCGGAFRFFSGYNVYQEYDEYRSHTTQAALGANARAG